MRNKIIAFLCISTLLTGCSAFDKDTSVLTSELFGGDPAAENSESENNLAVEGITDTLSANLEETDVFTEADTIANTEEANDLSNENPIDTADTVYNVGDTAQIGFNSVICNLTLDNAIRGYDAKVIAELYNSLHPEDTIATDLSEGLEFCVIEYTLDLKTTEGIVSAKPDVEFSVKGNTDDDTIVVDNKKYSNFSSRYYANDDTTINSGDIISNKIIFVVPTECESFQVELGDKSSQTAIFELR